MAVWEKKKAAPPKPGQPVGPKPTAPRPSPAENPNNPGASYNGMIAALGGLTVKGALFHQGYNNALADARPALYARTLNAMIRDWRQTFLDEQLPFGIIELSAGGQPQTLENFEVMMVDPCPFIREGQLQAARDLPNVGFACAYDQQVAWYHPFKKAELGERITRWALATQHGFPLPWEPARCVGVETNGSRLVLTFNQKLATHDDRPLEGFALAGPDQHFYPAKAEFCLSGKDERGRNRYDQNKIQVASDLVPQPMAVRYAWARNPLGNLVSGGHGPKFILPVPAFRSDHWDWPDAPFVVAGSAEASRLNRQKRSQAAEWARQRQRAEAELILKADKKQNPK